MMDSFNEFGLLLAAVYGGAGQVAMVTTEVATNSLGTLLLGADQRAARHIFAALPADHGVPVLLGESLQLSEWVDPKTDIRYLDLACSHEALAQVFGALADEIAHRVRTEEKEPHLIVIESLDEWRRLFRPAREISCERAKGLFGELLVLQQLAQLSPTTAPELWLGPYGRDHDFASANGDIEVKTSSGEGLGVVISSLDQLDPQGSARLVLVRIRLLETPQGRNLADMVQELVSMGVLRSVLVERLERAGFLLGVDSDEHRFIIDGDVLAWEVTSDFPGLRRSDLPEVRRVSEAVSHVSYRLDLAQASSPMDAAAYQLHLKQMVES